MDRVVYGDELLTLVVGAAEQPDPRRRAAAVRGAQRQAMQPVSASIRRVDFLLGAIRGCV